MEICPQLLKYVFKFTNSVSDDVGAVILRQRRGYAGDEVLPCAREFWLELRQRETGLRRSKTAVGGQVEGRGASQPQLPVIVRASGDWSPGWVGHHAAVTAPARPPADNRNSPASTQICAVQTTAAAAYATQIGCFLERAMWTGVIASWTVFCP